uniref:Diacylglycerol kinase n=5 Tax=Canis lupus TaxID=9612 RepID=A0A8C0T3C6_CANLF
MTRGICHLGIFSPKASHTHGKGSRAPGAHPLPRGCRSPAPAPAARGGRAASGGCSLLIPFPPARLRLREWLSQDLPCFRARALVFTRLRCIVCFQAASLGASVSKTFISHPAGSGCAVLSGFCAPSTPCPASCEPTDRSFRTKSSRSGVEPPGKCSALPCAPDGGGGGPAAKPRGREGAEDPSPEAGAREVRSARDARRARGTGGAGAGGRGPGVVWGREGLVLCGQARGSGGVVGGGGGAGCTKEVGGKLRGPLSLQPRGEHGRRPARGARPRRFVTPHPAPRPRPSGLRPLPLRRSRPLHPRRSCSGCGARGQPEAARAGVPSARGAPLRPPPGPEPRRGAERPQPGARLAPPRPLPGAAGGAEHGGGVRARGSGPGSDRARPLTAAAAPPGGAVSPQEPERMAGAGGQHHPPGAAGGAAAGAGAAVTPAAASAGPADDSSDSEAEQEGPQKLIRKVSTSGQIRTKTSIKEGQLLKQTSSFQRWKKRYFKLRGRTLYYAKDSKSLIFDEVDLSDASVAEASTKNANNSFTIITPFRRLMLCAENRKEMEDWMSSLKSVQTREPYEVAQFNVEHFSGMHNWYACSHARPTFCNVCRESLSGVTSHGLSCEVCKFKAHKRCAVRATNNCKWTTLASIGKDIIEDEDGVAMPHQWLEGNLPVSAKCAVCDKTCGSVLRLQDWKCLWCKTMVHTACKDLYHPVCPLGQCKVSVIPPIALNSTDSDGFCRATFSFCVSPLLVFVNSKSGDNQGVKFLRRFKQLLNPAQVFDLMNGGPHLGLRLFQKFDNFRILVCGGDGSVGWVLSEIDKLNLNKQCQLGVLPLGTGNDLARVLGWGGSYDDDTQLPQILEKLERASTKMLDRWSIMTYELKLPPKASLLPEPPEASEEFYMTIYEDSVAAHLTKILNSDEHAVIISSAKILCETVKDFVAKVEKSYEKTLENTVAADAMASKCSVLNEKLEQLLQALHTDSQATPIVPGIRSVIVEEDTVESSSEESLCESKEQLVDDPTKPPSQKAVKPKEIMLRANSLKKAVRQVIEEAGKVMDDQTVHPCEPVNQSFDNDSTETDESKEESKDDDAKESLTVKTAPAPRSPDGRTTRFQTDSGPGPAVAAGKENLPVLNTRIICPGLRAGLAASIAGSSIINKMLLANIDPFGATPFIDPDPDSVDGYSEKCVMNNYFGIGLDAKISLEFNNKREEHPEKCRSRTKNLMWYGVLGTRELLQRSYKNLEQRVQLECDGQYIPLPSLQGIAVLNIPSYAGGTNFWGGTKEDDIFAAPSFDDKILEVVAIFDSMQMAVSRVIKLQHHRIAQCRTVKITIFGDEGVPVQVDGEAWVQPPGIIKIVHKNRAQMLTRDRAFESTLKSWEDKQKCDSGKPVLRTHLYIQHAVDLATEEVSQMQLCSQAAEELITRICDAATIHCLLEQELAHAVNACSHALNKANPRFPESLTRDTATEIAINVKALYNETESLLVGRVPLQLESPHEERVSNALHSVEVELQKLTEIPWLYYILHPNEDEEPPMDCTKRNSRSTVFRIVPKFKKEKVQKQKTSSQPVQKWGTEEVAAWLDLLNLGEYKEIFIRHDIRGAELLHLERRDLKDLGITKVGHMKRILQGIKEFGRSTPQSEV